MVCKAYFKDGGTKRRQAVENALKDVDGKMESYYLAFGEHDFYLIADIPDNVATTALSLFSMGIPGAIMYEAGLSFFGFGIQPPMPSLGLIISDGRGYMTVAPWYTIFPGLTLVAIVLAFNFLGEGLIDVLDPRAD